LTLALRRAGDYGSTATLGASIERREARVSEPTSKAVVLTPSGVKARRIERHELGRFQKSRIPGNAGPPRRALWYVINATLFQGALLGLVPSRVKAAILRAFGAKVGAGFVCKPRVNIKYPWFLEIGDHVWLGEGVWIDNLCLVRVGSDVCVSQGCYLFTGNHDYNDPAFRFFATPIIIEDGVWLTAGARVPPGAHIKAGTVASGVLRGTGPARTAP
jgi:putative colanic acid biosynthesis acetyltransferase WcaF